MNTTSRAHRFPAVLATVASLVLSGLGLLWLAGGDRNALDHEGRPFSSALTVYPDGWANAIFFGCGLVAAATGLWLLADRHAAKPAEATGSRSAWWVAGVGIVALVPLMDASALMAVGYLPATVVGSLLGMDEANLSLLLSAGLLLQLTVLAAVGGFGWVIAGRIRDELRAVEHTETPAERALRLERATARTSRWTRIAVEAPLVYALTRVLMFFCVPGFEMAEFGEPILWAGLGLALSAAAGAWLTCGLVRPWGEVFPRWLPGLRGKRVPIGLAVVPGLLVAVMVATAAKDMFDSLGEDGASAVETMLEWPLVTLPTLLWPLWAFALAAATVNYGIRRRLTESRSRTPR